MFVVKSIEEIEKNLVEHVKFLDRYYESNKFLVSGRRNPRVGGIILVNSDSLEEISQIVKEDPFHRNDLADYEIIEFIIKKRYISYYSSTSAKTSNHHIAFFQKIHQNF